MTIENHILKLYERNNLWLMDLMKLCSLDNLKLVKNTIENKGISIDKLKPIKESLESDWFKKISYFDIKVTIAMIDKRDL